MLRLNSSSNSVHYAQSTVDSAMSLRLRKGGGFLKKLRYYRILKHYSLDIFMNFALSTLNVTQMKRIFQRHLQLAMLVFIIPICADSG